MREIAILWRFHAACAGMDPEFFFPKNGGNDPYRACRQVCNRCPVRRACLEQALDVESGDKWWRHGMFGGATPSERAAMHWLWEIKVAHPDREPVAA